MDFRKQFGASRVGLLTGDSSYNREAQVTVMTTEVFRSMLYEDKQSDLEVGSISSPLTTHVQITLQDVFAVVFDEFHYMNDRQRGTVWEESVINCPKHMLIVALSATMANVGDIAGWIQQTHGESTLIKSDFRPVPLRYFFAHKKGIYPLFRDPDSGPGAPNGARMLPADKEASRESRGGGGFGSGGKRRRRRLPDRLKVNSKLLALHQESANVAADVKEKGRGEGGGRRDTRGARGRSFARAQRQVPSFPYVVRGLKQRDLLPAIVFIFSRLGCDQAAADLSRDAGSLLSVSESEQVRERLNAFKAANPMVPVEPQRIEQLLHGIATHHAGLLPAYKSMVEELFASNLLKVVFATETLAAGINMPARTTVISVLSKRGDVGHAKLEPSQVLQMAGRAGRRGKDSEGAVVLMHSRFEDVTDAHRILLAPLDGIESKFRTSYSMAINVLRTRKLHKAKALVERSFGNFLQLKHLGPAQAGAATAGAELESITTRLDAMGVDIAGAKFYRKLWERRQGSTHSHAEERILGYLESQEAEVDSELVETILPISPLGSGLLMNDGRTGAMLGDHRIGGSFHAVLLMQSGDIIAAPPSTVRYISTDGLPDGVAPQLAVELMDRLSSALEEAEQWEEDGGSGLRRMPQHLVPADLDLAALGRDIQTIPPREESGHILRQRSVIDRVQQQMAEHAVHALGEADKQELLSLSGDIVSLEATVREGWKKQRKLKEPAWEEFQAVTRVLQHYEALDKDHQPTPLGDLVGAINGDNELWLALVLSSDSLKLLTDQQLAGVLPAVVCEYVRPGTFTLYDASPVVKDCINDLAPLAAELTDVQMVEQLDLPVKLDATLCGLVESWAGGVEWSELVESTSLDQGDLCRLLRKTLEVLRQIPTLPQPLVNFEVKNRARAAAMAMDRFPINDEALGLVGEEVDEEEAGQGGDEPADVADEAPQLGGEGAP
ncbi:unnamed protein product [Chrysoparadoxa australica]